MRSPLFHAFYTNAFGRRGAGFRHLFLAPWSATDRQRIGQWLQSIRPVDRQGVTVNCFRIGRTVHAAFARVDAAFARDEHGRGGGLLAHALLVPLDESRPPGSFTKALLDRERGLDRPQVDDADRLEALLEVCRLASEVDVRPFDLAELSTVEPGFAAAFVAAASRTGREEVVLPAASDDDLVDRLATVVGGLPPRLRLACRWAVGLRPTPDLSFVARPGPAVPSPGLGPQLEDGWRRCLATGCEGAVVGPADDWSVRSWEMLLSRRG